MIGAPGDQPITEEVLAELRPAFRTLLDAGFAIAVLTAFSIVHGFGVHEGYLAAFHVPSALFPLSIAEALSQSVGTIVYLVAIVGVCLTTIMLAWIPVRWLARLVRRTRIFRWLRTRFYQHLERQHDKVVQLQPQQRASRRNDWKWTVRFAMGSQLVGYLVIGWILVSILSSLIGHGWGDYARRDALRQFAGHGPGQVLLINLSYLDSSDTVVTVSGKVIARSPDLLAVFTLDGLLVIPSARVLNGSWMAP